MKRPADNLPKAASGAALVIVLSFVVLLTVIIVAYLSRATVERQVSNSSANAGRSDIIALSALNIIVGDLKQEIADGSTPSGTPPIYTPTAATNMVPQSSGTPGVGATPIPNLVRISIRDNGSGGTNPMPSPGVPSRASAVSSSDVSLNGRAASLPQWNSHYLIPRTIASTTIDSTPVTSFTAPDWVLVTRNGPAEESGIGTGTTALNYSALSNGNFVIGRYAYAIYDEGGIVDINAAGYPLSSPTPSPSPPMPYVFKGSLAFADLSPSTGINLPIDQVATIVGWRNYASIATRNNAPPTGSLPNYSFTPQSANDYYDFVRNRTDGFIGINAQPYPSPTVSSSRTDQAFVTRQDLLKFRRLTAFSQDALQFMGTFSRELNSPSYAPAVATATNPDFSQVRVTTAFTRFDGSAAAVGEPLVKTRFPLSRLAWITYKGPSALISMSDPVIQALLADGVSSQTIAAGTAPSVQKCFGLTYVSNDLWTYSHGATNRILTLSEVATAGREPDFFELLQAGILTGSLGQNTGGGVTPTGSTVFPDVHMGNTTLHILSIGASIIDQADPDSIPTNIQFNPSSTMWTAYGIESLPYVTQMYAVAGTSPDNSTDPNPWAIYLLFQVWNPHQNVPSATPTPTPPTPTATPPTVRLRIDGGLGIFKGGNGESWTNTGTDRFYNATGQSITLNQSPAFAPSPGPLTTSNTTGAGAANSTGQFVILPSPPAGSPTPGPVVGFRLPDFSYPTPAPTPTSTPVLYAQLGASTGASLSTKNRFNATMEVDVGGGTFVPYNRFIGINDSSSWITDDSIQLRTANSRAGAPRPFSFAQLTQTPPPAFMKSDPRSTRFGILQVKNNPTTSSRILEAVWPNNVASDATNTPNGYGGDIADGTPSNPAGVVEHAPLRFIGSPYYPATLCINSGASTSSRTSYADSDGVIRAADCAYPEPSPASTPSYSTPFYPSPTPASSPTPPTNTTLEFNDYKPVMLNRPFRSVAELGYAFRELPWKTLDFFTDASADAGLLDVFTINDEPNLVAGHVNLNTRQVPVLQSILAGTLQAELDANDTISKTGITATAAPVIAAKIVAATSMIPLRNRAELVIRSGLPQIIFPVPPSGSAHDQRVKARREVIPRAISTVTQTRTWNLLIDVIAQSGRYPPAAANLTQFVVEGEKRYWLHVAIDRFTGEIVDQQLEAVDE